MIAGGVLGIMFVALLRRVMVEDPELPFPESVAASQIHKAGRAGGTGATFLFSAMGVGAVIQAMAQFRVFATSWEKFVIWAKTAIPLGGSGVAAGKGGLLLSSPGVSPAYIGVGYIIGPRLGSLTFSGGLLAWGLFVPILTYFVGPQLMPETAAASGEQSWIDMATNVWKYIVRPIAIGGMLVSAVYTLYCMRESLFTGLQRSVGDVKKAASGEAATIRTDKDISFNWIMIGIGVAALATFGIYYVFAQSIFAALVATIVMVVAGFFFAAVSGYLVGIIGSSNNPVSGLTLSTLLVAAVLMVILGMKGDPGVAAVLGVAAVVCVAAAVAGEMLQDLKVGHILGGTPWKMQVGDLIGILVASLVMFVPLIILHQGDIKMGGEGLGGEMYPAPQASLMALLSRGIVGGEMAWPLVIVGMLMGVGFILMQVKSPMIVSVGMYLPLETTFAIFIGGVIKGIVDRGNAKKGHNGAQISRVENTGVLLAAGLIAGEALIGLLFAALAMFDIKYNEWLPGISGLFPLPFYISCLVFLLIGWILVKFPLGTAGSPDEPAH
jgi:putative OPT family oligopeptide transporter